jgi:hypothetical protein
VTRRDLSPSASLCERLNREAPLSLGTREKTLSESQSSRRVRVFPSRDSTRTEKREGRCLRSPCRSRPCTRDRQLGFPGDMTREARQGSGSSERMKGYDQFISLLFCVLQITYVSYIHPCCFICSHVFVSSVLSFYNMLYVSVLILQLFCLYCYLFISSCSVIINEPCLYTYFIYMIYMLHMLCVLMIHIVMYPYCYGYMLHMLHMLHMLPVGAGTRRRRCCPSLAAPSHPRSFPSGGRGGAGADGVVPAVVRKDISGLVKWSTKLYSIFIFLSKD